MCVENCQNYILTHSCLPIARRLFYNVRKFHGPRIWECNTIYYTTSPSYKWIEHNHLHNIPLIQICISQSITPHPPHTIHNLHLLKVSISQVSIHNWVEHTPLHNRPLIHVTVAHSFMPPASEISLTQNITLFPVIQSLTLLPPLTGECSTIHYTTTSSDKWFYHFPLHNLLSYKLDGVGRHSKSRFFCAVGT